MTLEREILHAALLKITIADWHIYVIVHAMIDLGRVTSIECQHPTCYLPSRAFACKSGRGQSDGLTIDHINPRWASGSHRIENLRLLHNACNNRGNRAMTGRRHTPETRALLSAKLTGNSLIWNARREKYGPSGRKPS